VNLAHFAPGNSYGQSFLAIRLFLAGQVHPDPTRIDPPRLSINSCAFPMPFAFCFQDAFLPKTGSLVSNTCTRARE